MPFEVFFPFFFYKVKNYSRLKYHDSKIMLSTKNDKKYNINNNGIKINNVVMKNNEI